MPRNGQGQYSKPPNTTAQSNTQIKSAVFNSVVDDLVVDANTARPVTAGGTGGVTVADAQANLSVVGYNDQPLTASQQAQARDNISAPLSGHLFGLTLSNNVTDPTNDIDIAAGSAASTEIDPVLMVLASAMTKRLDAAWAVGSGNGGLDAGSIANATYHLWLIQRSDTGVVDVLFSTSATSPTMPTNYDRKRRVGSVVRLGGTILAFRQNGNRFMLGTVQPIYTGVGNVTNAQLATFGPFGVRFRPILQLALASNANSLAAVQMGDGDLSSISSNVQTIGGTSSANNTAIIDEFYTDTSGRIRHSVIISAGSLSSYSVFSIGWLDDRGMAA